MLHIPSPLAVLRALLGRPFPDDPVAPDPIDHPALRRMSPRELADLPFPRPAPRRDG